jgi:tetratricopeptide (TPR) repeat protein
MNSTKSIIKKLAISSARAMDAILLHSISKQGYQMAVHKYKKALRHDEAIRHLKTVSLLNPANLDAYLLLIEIYCESNRCENALSNLEDVSKHIPLIDRAWVNLGFYFKRADEKQKAVYCYKTSLEINPNNIHALTDLSEIYTFSEKNYEEAFRLIGLALKIEPENANALWRKADVLAEMGEYLEAIKCYEEVIAYIPDDPILHFNFANTLNKAQKYQEAIKQYRRSIELKPGLVDAMYGLGVLYWNSGQNDEAISILKLASGFGHSESKEYLHTITGEDTA